MVAHLGLLLAVTQPLPTTQPQFQQLQFLEEVRLGAQLLLLVVLNNILLLLHLQ